MRFSATLNAMSTTCTKKKQNAADDCDSKLRSPGNRNDIPDEMGVELVELFLGPKELIISSLYGFYKNTP